jgi:hypothetical protein
MIKFQDMSSSQSHSPEGEYCPIDRATYAESLFGGDLMSKIAYMKSADIVITGVVRERRRIYGLSTSSPDEIRAFYAPGSDERRAVANALQTRWNKRR